MMSNSESRKREAELAARKRLADAVAAEHEEARRYFDGDPARNRIGDPCEAVEGVFAFGPVTCGKRSVVVAVDPVEGTTHVACADHRSAEQAPAADLGEKVAALIRCYDQGCDEGMATTALGDALRNEIAALLAPTDAPRHTHMTRDIKPVGHGCPACDLLHKRSGEQIDRLARKDPPVTSNDELRRLLAEDALAMKSLDRKHSDGARERLHIAATAALPRLLDDSDEAERLRGLDDDASDIYLTMTAERDAARAAHDRLLADVRGLADEWDRLELTAHANRLRALVARHTSEGGA